MMKIIVYVYAALADLLGSRMIEITTSAKSISELINFLSSNYNTLFKETVIDDHTQELQSGYKILVNGYDTDLLQKLKTGIKEGDVIIFFPPVSGG